MPASPEQIFTALCAAGDFPLVDFETAIGDLAVDLAHELDRRGHSTLAGTTGDELVRQIVDRALATHYGIERDEMTTDNKENTDA